MLLRFGWKLEMQPEGISSLPAAAGLGSGIPELEWASLKAQQRFPLWFPFSQSIPALLHTLSAPSSPHSQEFSSPPTGTDSAVQEEL